MYWLDTYVVLFQVPSSPPPLAAPIARRLSVSASVAGEEGLMSCVLPEELLVEILAERLQVFLYDQINLFLCSKNKHFWQKDVP